MGNAAGTTGRDNPDEFFLILNSKKHGDKTFNGQHLHFYSRGVQCGEDLLAENSDMNNNHGITTISDNLVIPKFHEDCTTNLTMKKIDEAQLKKHEPIETNILSNSKLSLDSSSLSEVNVAAPCHSTNGQNRTSNRNFIHTVHVYEREDNNSKRVVQNFEKRAIIAQPPFARPRNRKDFQFDVFDAEVKEMKQSKQTVGKEKFERRKKIQFNSESYFADCWTNHIKYTQNDQSINRIDLSDISSISSLENDVNHTDSNQLSNESLNTKNIFGECEDCGNISNNSNEIEDSYNTKPYIYEEEKFLINSNYLCQNISPKVQKDVKFYEGSAELQTKTRKAEFASGRSQLPKIAGGTEILKTPHQIYSTTQIPVRASIAVAHVRPILQEGTETGTAKKTPNTLHTIRSPSLPIRTDVDSKSHTNRYINPVRNMAYLNLNVKKDSTNSTNTPKLLEGVATFSHSKIKPTSLTPQIMRRSMTVRPTHTTIRGRINTTKKLEVFNERTKSNRYVVASMSSKVYPTIRKKFYISESCKLEEILADQEDRRIKAICLRCECEMVVYSKMPRGGSLQNVVILSALTADNLQRCVRSLDARMNWCLSAQINC